MYRELADFLDKMEVRGCFSSPKVSEDVEQFAISLEDEDYRAALFGGARVRFCRAGRYDLAEQITLLARGPERAGELRRLAEELARNGQDARALQVYSLVREAVLAAKYSTGVIQELEESARSLANRGHTALARIFWEDAIALARPRQSAGGHEGPESSGILIGAVEAFCGMGDVSRASEIAELIELPILREQAAIALIEARKKASKE